MDRESLIEICRNDPEKAADLILMLMARLEKAEARISELEARLNKNSQNSSKPPSSDGYKKPLKNNNSRKNTGRKQGGQNGHTGKTIKMSETPNTIVDHYPKKCLKCKQFQACKNSFEYHRRQVHDIVKPALNITEHRAFFGKCKNSGKDIKGAFPGDIKCPVSYGPLIKSFVIMAKEYQFIPYGRVCEFLKDFFGIGMSQGTVANIEKQCADNLTDYYDDVMKQAMNADVLHSDETGIRVLKALWWLHVYSNDFFTVYAYHKNRGKEGMDAIGILSFFNGLLCHDFWKSYFNNNCTHSMCNAHILRELKAMLELYGEKWADRLIKMLIEIKTRVEDTPDQALTKHLYTRYRNRWLEHIKKAMKLHPPPKKIIGRRGRPKKGKVRSLLERLYDHADDILRFAKESIAPFDNNLAERDLRMMKTKLKISGCFRSNVGAESFCKIRSYIATIRKQGGNVFEALQKAVIGIPRFST